MMRCMKSLGIIAEFNPFHQGHQYLIEEAMRQTASEVCVAVMSGSFMQRGSAAVSDKWTRAKEAVKNGVNLVVELPTVYAVSSAEYFAKGGVGILEGFGCIDVLAFGSESGDIGQLQSAAAFLKDKDEELHSRIQAFMKMGHSYPKARQIAAADLCLDVDETLIREPNNILALEYLKQLKTLNPLTIKRKGCGYHQSASMIRKKLADENPQAFAQMDRTYWALVAAKVLQSDSAELEKILSAGDGLGNKLKKEIRYASSTEELIGRIKSKAYTYSRISRLLTQTLLDIDKEAVENAKGYIRILAFDEIGAKFVKEMKKKECATLPIITNINRELFNHNDIQETLKKDILASDIYNIITKNNLYDYADFIVKPYRKL